MKLNEDGLRDSQVWKNAGYHLPEYNRDEMKNATIKHPFWIHLGAGNIFRAFQAQAVQKLLNEKVIDRGLIVAEGFDEEIIEKVNRKTDDYSILVTLCADGSIEKTVVGSIAESLHMDTAYAADFERLKEIFCNPSLQIVSFTITEKGYSLTNAKGSYLSSVCEDFENGPTVPVSYMGKTTALLYERYRAGKYPIAMVSMDNCSHNGSKLYEAIYSYAKKWVAGGWIPKGFLDYISNTDSVTYPWTMIDKITPRPDPSIEAELKKDGLEDIDIVITDKHTYTSLFVNAEESEYLVIEDAFPNGRPKLEKAGFFFTDRETVDKTEKMKVCTCLNPLHTALAVFGCLLNCSFIFEAVGDKDLKVLVKTIGYKEGLPVVHNPGIIRPTEFLDTVLNNRIPNPYMPDTPKRIATDTSQKLAIRFGETIRCYMDSSELDIHTLEGIPLVLAGWLRYLLAVDDKGQALKLSPDPLLDFVCEKMQALKMGDTKQAAEILKPLLLDTKIFGVDLYEAGLADKVCNYFTTMSKGPGAVRSVLQQFSKRHN